MIKYTYVPNIKSNNEFKYICMYNNKLQLPIIINNNKLIKITSLVK